MPRHLESLRKAAAPVVENLEGRVLMSSTSLLNGKLTIEGGKHDDAVLVSYVPGSQRQYLVVNVNGTESTWTAAKVKKIEIFGGRGDDALSIVEYYGAIDTPAFIYAGRGDDTVVGGSGNDWLLGQRGNDELNGGAGVDHLIDEKFENYQDPAPIKTELATPMAVGGDRATPFAVNIPSYTVVDLGLLPGGQGDRGAWNLDNADTLDGLPQPNAVGFSVIQDTGGLNSPHGMLKPGTRGRNTDLGTLGGSTAGSTSIAYDINEAGVIVGQSQTVRGGSLHGFWWQNGIMRDVGSLGGNAGNTIVWGISNLNTIVGESNGTAVYKPGPGGRWLPIPDTQGQGNLSGRAREVNDIDRGPPIPFPDGISDFIVGFDAQNQQAFLFDQALDSTIDLGTIRGANTSEALDINNDGNFTIVGVSGENTNIENGFWWRASTGVMVPLPTPANYRTKAFGVRDADNTGLTKIVGRTRTFNNNQIIDHAAMWVESTAGAFQLVDLQALTSGGTGRVLEEAHAINNSDFVVATGTVPGDTARHAFLLVPQRSTAGQSTLELTGNFTKAATYFAPGVPPTGQLIFNLYGEGSFQVNKRNVVLNLFTTDLKRGRLPSQGVADFVFNTNPTRWVTSVSKGRGAFSGVGTTFVTLADGTIGDFITRFTGTTYRVNKRDMLQGEFVGISRRGKILRLTNGTFQNPQGQSTLDGQYGPA